MKDKDVISVGTSNINTNLYNNNLYDNKSVVSKGTHRSNKVYNFFDKKSEKEFLEEDDE